MNKKELKKRAKKIKNIKKKRLENKVFMKLGAKLRAYLFTGILVTAPVAITFYLAYKLQHNEVGLIAKYYMGKSFWYNLTCTQSVS